ncbi:MAG: hypothetical protein AAFO09_00965 [Pseudomonadota bacterium]
MSRPQMFLIAGVNGSGKSSFTRNIFRKEPALKVIDPDAIAKDITGSFAMVDTEAMSAGRAALLMVQDCINGRQSLLCPQHFQKTPSSNSVNFRVSRYPS